MEQCRILKKELTKLIFFLFITFGIDLNIQNYWQSIVLFTLTSDYLCGKLRQVLHVVLVLFNFMISNDEEQSSFSCS